MTLLLLISLATFLLVGLSAGRSAGSREAFFVAERRGSSLAITGSLVATVVGGSATIGVAGLAYVRGMTAAWWTLVGAIGLAVLGLVLVGRVRAHAGVYTLPGLAGRLFGPRVRIGTAIIVTLAWMGVVSGQIVAASRVLSVIGVGSPSAWMIVFTGVLVLYAIAGGQKAIIRTDLLQAVLILAGVALAAVYMCATLGYTGAFSDGLPVGSLDFPVSSAFGWADLGSMLVLVGAVYLVGPDIYTRLLSARDTRTARKATLTAAVVVVPVAITVAMLGMTARYLSPDLLPEQALPWLVTHALPPYAAALLLAGMVAALMSSADSTLLGQAVILADDVITRVYPLAEKHVVVLARACVAVLGLLALLLALSFQGVIASLMFAYSVFTSGVVGPMLLGLLRGRLRVDGAAALCGMCAGGVCGLASALPWFDVPLKPHLALIGLGLSIVVTLVLSQLRRGNNSVDGP